MSRISKQILGEEYERQPLEGVVDSGEPEGGELTGTVDGIQDFGIVDRVKSLAASFRGGSHELVATAVAEEISTVDAIHLIYELGKEDALVLGELLDDIYGDTDPKLDSVDRVAPFMGYAGDEGEPEDEEDYLE